MNRVVFFVFITGLLTTFCCFAQSNSHTWTIDDTDKISYGNPYTRTVISLSDETFKAIDPKYIANMHGLTKTSIVNSKKNRINKIIAVKEFSLITFDDQMYPNYETENFFTTRNAQQKWKYYINNKHVMPEYAELVSALMPQAIEKIEFMPSDRYLSLPKTKGLLPESAYRYRGDINIFTRDISQSIIDDNATVYLLNGEQAVTRKIYEAINPVFIRSLIRITGHAEIAGHGYENVTEIVKINLFKFQEVVERVKYIRECPECEVYLVDNIRFDFETYILLNRFHFKDICEIIEDEEAAFAPYKGFFPSENLPGKKRITIISL